jgi:hypothetical protein
MGPRPPTRCRGSSSSRRTSSRELRKPLAPAISHRRLRNGTPGPKLLAIERSKASFSSDDLSEFVLGKETLARQKRLLEAIEKEPAFDKSRWPYLGRTERFKMGIRKEKRMFNMSKELGWDAEDNKLVEELLDIPAGFGLHKSMFSASHLRGSIHSC